MPDSLSSFIERALTLVGETPFCADALREALGELVVGVEIEGESCWLRRDRQSIDVLTTAPIAHGRMVRVLTTGAALLEVLDGHVELSSALRRNTVRVRATTHAAARLFMALKCFVEGCARSSRGPQLLLEFRNRYDARIG